MGGFWKCFFFLACLLKLISISISEYVGDGWCSRQYLPSSLSTFIHAQFKYELETEREIEREGG